MVNRERRPRECSRARKTCNTPMSDVTNMIGRRFASVLISTSFFHGQINGSQLRRVSNCQESESLSGSKLLCNVGRGTSAFVDVFATPCASVGENSNAWVSLLLMVVSLLVVVSFWMHCPWLRIANPLARTMTFCFDLHKLVGSGCLSLSSWCSSTRGR